MSRRMTLFCLTALGLGQTFAAKAEDAPPPSVPYWDNWTDSKGVTHLTKCKLTNFTFKTLAPHADPQWTQRAHEGQARMVVSIQPAHWNGGWHANPQVQWIVPLSGTWFVQSMDGTRVELNAGDALLSEDLGAVRDAQGHAGHLSGNVGDAPVALMITQFRDARASHKACPAN
ncbi:cupin domain-containing protein [Kozakia baliensis]|uniref:Uncharacterized protein n=1 Tax=Kozakia baliensis TaxID=153496 RepID=A0A1D8UVF8_9PROT|nr:hypothetical protein [Kozakia baliensis]AOX17635.1 hypothetical protein A0U89_11290 [Kozakia baliensis]AOX20514.1 hypothetical protein A0U90_09615 [Kozakia baliensis]GBR31278.1 hypothetical protein AA0488_2234 [Kozakia baliensis NRIC 0488]GEL62877.1 hypothetical protein KBA01_01630 [Kozakia baliensis]